MFWKNPGPSERPILITRNVYPAWLSIFFSYSWKLIDDDLVQRGEIGGRKTQRRYHMIILPIRHRKISICLNCCVVAPPKLLNWNWYNLFVNLPDLKNWKLVIKSADWILWRHYSRWKEFGNVLKNMLKKWPRLK